MDKNPDPSRSFGSQAWLHLLSLLLYNLGSGHDCQEADETEFRSGSGDAAQWIALRQRRVPGGNVGEAGCPHMAFTKRFRPTNDCQIALVLTGAPIGE
jgi:hypothetical protein